MGHNFFGSLFPIAEIMLGKNTKRSGTERKLQPTVLHESSADNAQDLPARENLQFKNQSVSFSSRKNIRQNSSDGADQERGSNH